MRTPPLAYPYPSLRQVLMLSLLVFPLMQALLLLPGLAESVPLLSLLLAEFSLLLIAVVTIRRHRWVVEDLFLLNAVSRATLWLILPLGIAAGLLAGEFDARWAPLWQWLDWTLPLTVQRSIIDMQVIRSGLGSLSVILAIGLVPAVCEEVFFRGFVYTGLQYHHGSRVAMLGSATLFAAAHMNPWQFPALLLLGLWLAWLVQQTHSIYPAIIAHALNNLLSVGAINLRAYVGIDPLGALEPLPAPTLVLAMTVFGLGIWRLRQLRPRMPLLSPFLRAAP